MTDVAPPFSLPGPNALDVDHNGEISFDERNAFLMALYLQSPATPRTSTEYRSSSRAGRSR